MYIAVSMRIMFLAKLFEKNNRNVGGTADLRQISGVSFFAAEKRLTVHHFTWHAVIV